MTAIRKTLGKRFALNYALHCWALCRQAHQICNNERGGIRINSYFVGCLLFCSAPAFAITEAQFIEKVLAQDKLLEEAQIGLDIKQIERDASRDNYQNWKANLSIALDYRYRDLDRDATSTSTYTKNSQDYPKKISLSFEKRFLTSPLTLAVGVSRSQDKTRESRFKRISIDDDGRGAPYARKPSQVGKRALKEYQTTQYISVKYPLLKPDSNATSLKTHHRDIVDLKRQQLLFYETKEDFLDDRLNDYLSWLLYQKQMLINQELLNSLRRLNPKDDAETVLLKSTVYEIEQYDSDTRLQLQAMQEKLSVLLDDRTVLTEIPSFDLGKRADLVTENLSNYLQTRNRDLQRIAMNIELSQIEIGYYQKQNLPALDFTVRAEKNLNSRNTSATSTFDDDRITYWAGLEFKYPLGGNISNRVSLSKSQLGMRKLEISYQEKLQDLLADIQLLNTLLTLDEERLLAAIDTAVQSTQIENKKYQSGETSLRDLLQAYKDERTVKLQHIDDMIDYQVNSIEYDNLLDRIITTSCDVTLSDCDS